MIPSFLYKNVSHIDFLLYLDGMKDISLVVCILFISVIGIGQNVELTQIGKMTDTISEPSGLGIQYNTSNGHFEYWANNDYGNRDSIYSFRINDLGTVRRALHIDHDYIDWEDMAQDEAGNIYLADFGNFVQPQEYNIIKIPDPNTFTGHPTTKDTISFIFPFAGVKDNEAIFHLNDSLYIFTKRVSPGTNPNLEVGRTYCFSIPDYPMPDGSKHIANLVGTLYTKIPSDTSAGNYAVTAADISPDKKKIILISYSRIWVISCFNGVDFFGGTINSFDLKTLRQYEGVVFINNHEVVISKEGHITIPGYSPRLYYLNLHTYVDGSCIECNKVINGLFNDDNLAWSPFLYSPAQATFDFSNGQAEIDLTTLGNSFWHANIRHKSLVLESGKTYRVSYKAWAEDDRNFSIIVNDQNGAIGYGYKNQAITTVPTTYSYEFTMNSPTDYNSYLSFNVGKLIAHKVFFDDIKLEEVDCICPKIKTFHADIENQLMHYEADSIILGQNKIIGDSVIYDAGIQVNLNTGFEVQLGAIFNAEVGGCN